MYKNAKKIIGMLLLLAAPAVSFYLLESMTHSIAEDMGWPLIFLNLLFYYLVYWILQLIFRSTKISVPVGTLIFMVIALADYYVIQFRSVPLYPWDLLSIGTAASVAGNFDYKLKKEVVIYVLLFLVMIAAGMWSNWKMKKISRQVHLCTVLCSLALFMTCFTTAQMESVHKAVGFYEYLFTPNAFCHINGFVVSFVSNMQYLKVSKPNNYSKKKVDEILDQYQSAETTDGTKPNVIVIMNEAFSDPAVLGPFETNTDYMPFIHRLTKDTVKGYVFVSVKGGNTANTEYEFLTGNSMAYLPIGSIPYQQYIRNDVPSLASQLKTEGYITYAMHPYRANGWNRNKVYEYFGFDECMFKESFSNSEILREYVTDWATYEKIIELYENKIPGQPMFVFDVTMQNHSSYSKEYDNFVPDIQVSGTENDKLLERYLSLVKVSDEAFEELVYYFARVNEPTVILMFGDHQPADWVVSPIYTLNGTTESALSFEEEQKRYEVPFVIWANYPIEEAYVNEISTNYLSTLLLDTAGMDMNAYNYYLKELYEKYPVITANLLVDAEGTYKGTEKQNMTDTSLVTYHMMNYARLFSK